MRAPLSPSGRWAIAWASSAVMLVIGTLYSWGIFTQPLLVAFQWGCGETIGLWCKVNDQLGDIGGLVPTYLQLATYKY